MAAPAAKPTNIANAMLIVRTGLFLTDMRNINAPGIGTFPP
jgi:hypothetical protein